MKPKCPQKIFDHLEMKRQTGHYFSISSGKKRQSRLNPHARHIGFAALTSY